MLISLISRMRAGLAHWGRAGKDSQARKKLDASKDATSVATDAQDQFALGRKHSGERRYERACACFEAAIALKHDFADAHCHLALALCQLGRLEEAVDEFSMALHFSPAMSQAWLGLAHAENMQGKVNEALGTVERLLAREASADAYNLRGALLVAKGDVAAAIASFESAVVQDPNSILGHANLGYVLFREVGEYKRGAKHIARALELDRDNEDARCNYSMILCHYGEHDHAVALCDELLSAHPRMHEARLNRALVLLQLGRYDQAWDDYEARKLVRSNYNARYFPCPEWQAEDLGEKTILIHGEQGLGDEIMFSSCFQEMIARARHCVIECEPRLEQLFKRSFGTATVVSGKQSYGLPAWWTDEPKIDLHIAAGSLPRHFRRSGSAFPRHCGYLYPAPDRISCWRERLANLGSGLKVGISWRGGMPSTRRGLRSIDLSALAPILSVQGVQFVSLQYGDTRSELRALRGDQGVHVHCWREAIDDLDEGAALITALDLVISVCTAVIHLAGAVGRPVWVLVPSSPEWRYQASGGTMPWYPSARLFRQPACDDWRMVIDEVARELQNETRRRSG